VGHAEVKFSQISLTFNSLTGSPGSVAMTTWYSTSTKPSSRSELLLMGGRFKNITNLLNCQGPLLKEWISSASLTDFGFTIDSTEDSKSSIGYVTGNVTVSVRGNGNFT